MVDNKNLHDTVNSIVKKMLSELKKNKDDINARTSFIRGSLLLITQEFSTEEYSFNLAMEILVEGAYKNLSECLVKILDETDFEESEETCATCFAALYALSLIYKKQRNIEKLFELLGDEYTVFRRYPLYYEVHSRYYKRVNNCKEALSYDKKAINILHRKKITNPALCISYASTVCTMLKENDPSCSDDDIKLAKKYIDAAIKFNPNYSKYYFLKAKLVFLSAVHSNCELPALEAAEKKAKALIEDADAIHYESYHGTNVFKAERENYDSFRNYIDEVIQRKKTPRFIQSDTVLDSLKERILMTKSQDICVSSSALPPIPKLRKNEKYIFICYSSKDFQSVYCDLIELYKRKVPFIYDEKLTNGVGWQEQVKRSIADDNCVGVVFYLSKNIFSTNSVFEEIKFTEEAQKPNFCVNLEGSKIPSQILCDLIIERYQTDPTNYALPGERMNQFLNNFDDNQVFTHKFKENGNSGTNHLDAFINAITIRFPQIVIGD